MRGIAVSYITGPERCAVTELELAEDAQAWTLDARVLSAIACPNPPYSLSRRIYGVWLCWDHCKLMERGGGAMP
jgi:hypothetical protein